MRLFLLSSGHADGLAAMARAAGWTVGAGRGGRDAPPSVALIDVRGADAPAFAAALAAVRAQAAAGVPVIAIGEGLSLDALIDAGATHPLDPDVDAARLARMLRAALRQAPARPAVERRAGTGERPFVTALAAALTDDGAPLAVLRIGLTRFEIINGAFGRATGDALLRAVEMRLAPLAEGVRLARLGGPEFAILTGGGGAALAGRTVAAIERPFLVDGHMVSVGAHVGVAARIAGDDARALMRRAGVALAEARASDGAPVRILSAADERAALFDASLTADLRRALGRDEIEVLFQPQVSITGGVVVGVEALARWRHPVHGSIGATTLFAAAARSNYVAALSAHVQARALAAAAAWPATLAHLRLSINLTAADIARPGFVEKFFAGVDASGFPRARLTVELTESEVVADLADAAALLAALRAGGCRVAIDDFGTGYSSLAYLKALPLDYLKIDKQLAQDIAGTTRDRIVVRGVIDMARSLGLAVIAEGVETEQQLTLLASEGCQFYQGFLFAAAVGCDELERLVA